MFLSKRRILELYGNVIEFGDGIYGIEAAARQHFGCSAHELSREQISMLVAIMPSPRKRSPVHPTEATLKRKQWILDHVNLTSPP